MDLYLFKYFPFFLKCNILYHEINNIFPKVQSEEYALIMFPHCGAPLHTLMEAVIQMARLLSPGSKC